MVLPISTLLSRFLAGILVLFLGAMLQAAPIVSNVTFTQRMGTKFVDVSYDLTVDGPNPTVKLEVSSDGGETWTVPVTTISGAVGAGITAGTGKLITWDAGTDWNAQSSSQVKVRVTAWDLLLAGAQFVPIVGGDVQRGDNLDGLSDAPVQTIAVSNYYLQATETTKAQWDTVRSWGGTHGYTDFVSGAGKASNHPVQTVSWYDVVKWCNAASEMEGLMPVYYTDAGQTTVYRTGSTNIDNRMVKWSANGYRLPTEGEWEKAARGGFNGKRFPWGDTITHSQANYQSSSSYGYDTSTTRGYHPNYNDSVTPYTSPVGSFSANGFGLYDMAGNVWEWCWDWYGSYVASTDPRGPLSGSYRGQRGGGWDASPLYARCAWRNNLPPDSRLTNVGFRPARGRVEGANGVASVSGSIYTTSVLIRSQPQSINVAQHDSASLSVAATGIGALSYQWQKDGVDISGETNPTLNIRSFKPWHVGAYRVRVSDSVDSVWSNVAQLSLSTTQPSSLWQDLLLFLPFAGSNTDISPSARTITQSNVSTGESPAGTPVGSAFFNGTNSRMDFSPNLPNLSSMTFSTWFRTTKITGNQSLFADWDDAAGNDVSAAIIGDKLFVQSTKNGANLSWTSESIVKAGEWMHFTFIMGATQSLIVVNGQLLANLNAPANNVGYKLRSNIGYFNYGAGEYFYSGNLAALRIYGRALTLQEAQDLYSADAPVRDQVITFNAIADKLTSDSITLSATGGDSGNPVTFAVTEGPGVITDGVLTFTGVGQVTITASQAGNDNYLAAEDVIRTFNVTKATSTILFANRLHVDDGSPRPVTFTTDPADLSYALLYAGSETAPSLPGRYEVTASLDDPLYSGSGTTNLTILGLSGHSQRLLSGSDQTQETNGTDFGRVVIGRVATQTFTITNPGSEPVQLTGDPLVEILGEQAGDFQISVAPAAEIPAGGSVSFEVRFAPTQPGDRQAVVQLECADLANGPITFAVGGFGALPALLTQTITFNLPSSLYLSQSPVPLVATASSGLPVTLTVLEGPATLTDGELQVTEPGKIRIEARQAGFGNFTPAKPVVRTLTVKADPTGLTLADLTQTYNGTPRAITVLGTEEEATVTYLIDKLPSDQPPTNAGSYPVTVTAGTVTKTGTLVIARAPLIVQVADQRKLVGEANPDVSTAFTLSGFVLGDNELNSLLPRPITVTTKAKDTSPPGLYPITSIGGGALNYTLIHRPGTLVVEGHVGSFEALLRDPDTSLPVGLLKLTVPSTGLSLTASLMLADEGRPIALAGPLALNRQTRLASVQLTRTVNASTIYRLNLTLSLFGELSVEVLKNEELIAQADDGTRLRDAVKGETVPQAGAYTAVLEPGDEDNTAPSAPGWATAKLDAVGTMDLAGRLGDGTAFTASLPVDVSDGYRLFVQPYKRGGAHLGGDWSMSEHPEAEGAWQARGVKLTWLKGPNEKDPGYRAGFGPLTVALEMDAWKPASKTAPLVQLLGADQWNVSYDATGSPSEAQLASRVAVDASGTLRVLAPVTNPLNVRKWTAKVNPATGAYSGSFELFDLSQKRKVNFTGVLRQATDAEGDGLQGRGLFILPPLKGAVSTETTTGRMEFRRPD